MTPSFIHSLSNCHDLSLVGGKALGLCRQMEAGFPVPSERCVTAAAYTERLHNSDFQDQDEWHRIIGLSEG